MSTVPIWLQVGYSGEPGFSRNISPLTPADDTVLAGLFFISRGLSVSSRFLASMAIQGMNAISSTSWRHAKGLICRAIPLSFSILNMLSPFVAMCSTALIIRICIFIIPHWMNPSYGGLTRRATSALGGCDV